MEYSALYKRVGETEQKTLERGSTWNMAGNLPSRVNILTVGEYLCKKPTLTRINSSKLSHNPCARACVCMCVHTYVHSNDYAMFTFGRRCFNITTTAIPVRNIFVLRFAPRRDCIVQTVG